VGLEILYFNLLERFVSLVMKLRSSILPKPEATVEVPENVVVRPSYKFEEDNPMWKGENNSLQIFSNTRTKSAPSYVDLIFPLCLQATTKRPMF